jgi:acyl-CoA hydrolase
MEKLNPEAAAARFETTDSVGMPLATGQPAALLAALGERDDWEELRVYGALLAVGTALFNHSKVHYLSGFYGPIERALRDSGANISFAPADFRRFTPLMRDVDPRVMMTAASPPDADGYCSLSLHAGASVNELHRAGSDPDRMLIAEVSPNYPRTRGIEPDHPHRLHTDEIDVLVESEASPLPLPDAEPTDVDRRIAENCTTFIADGSTLQTGIGAVPSMIATLLAEGDGGDYGIHSEMFTTGLMCLHEAGKVTNQKGQFDGVSVATFAAGTEDLYRWLHENDDVAFLPVDIVNSPAYIRANRQMITINAALAVDIQGQVVADTIGGRQFSGIGGHEDFVTGPALDLNDRALLCLPSTVELDGEVVSRIVPWFERGTVITTPRHQVDVVVTEYGAAELQGKTIHGRGVELARIAHPDFREELLAAAERASGGNSPIPPVAG